MPSQIHTREKEDESGRLKTWKMYELEEYRWINYSEAKELGDNIAACLQQNGLKAVKASLLNTVRHLTSSIACFMLGAVVTTAYDSMPPDAVAHIIKETNPKAVLTEVTLMSTLSEAFNLLPESCKVHTVFYTGERFEAPDALDKLQNNRKLQDATIVRLDTAHEQSGLAKMRQTPDNLALIMYTSGTSGTPKGVELTHGNIIASMGAAEHLVSELLSGADHTYIGFLPLAHVLEFLLEFIFITMGIPVGYGTVRTLMPDSVSGPGGQGKGKGDLEALQPTIMAGVPSVWERIRNGITGQLEKKPWVIRKMFYATVELKWLLLQLFGRENVITRIIDKTVFYPIRSKTGGHLMYGLAGGAPISFDTHKFIFSTVCFLLQGYGLTECCGLGAVTLPMFGPLTGVIGPPSPSIEFRLVDVPETDYVAEQDKGELWLRGPSVMRGYYAQPELTKEALTEDGWFRTGDVAHVRKDGMIAIIDRAKNLVKLSHGEYIALEALESIYRNSKDIQNICVVANSNMSHIVAVVEAVDQHADKASLIQELQNTAKKANCSRAETVKDIVITQDVDWSEKFLTTSGKLKRKELYKAYENDIKQIYSQ
ncbi:long-chain fatty acid-CoA ligase [Apophysomyces ossiformis]|uniref:Long-chain fatty acid-CoA ligase n=1 Tax=Apophysomyces ossiformis TaxID=679940 RepID=A0A8H7BDF7_9FUNG|nr:long-chain fatty acid-CoA ligase [Apophysomyces ossiformis]